MDKMTKLRLGQKIKKLRSMHGISQEHMANVLEMNPRKYGRLENEGLDVTMEMLDTIARELHLGSKEELMAFDEQVFFSQCTGAIGVNSQNNYHEVSTQVLEQMQQRIDAQQQEIEFLREQLKRKG